MTRTRPILRWPGGKSRLLKHILPLIAERPHVCYCETFAGGLATMFAKQRSKVEIVNDVNGDLIALYRNLQFHLPALLHEMRFMVSSRQNLYDFNAQPGLTEIQRAVRFLVMNRTSFGGGMRSFGVAKTPGGGVALDRKSLGATLARANDRLNGVVVERLPYERCMRNYDSRDTLFFLDPPYVNADTDAYDGFSPDQMKEFAERCHGLKGRWIATVDDSPLTRKLFADCQVRAVSSQNRLANNRTHSALRFGELIITQL